MKLIKTLPMNLVATTGMTIFSYLISLHKKEKFLEPLILNQLMFPQDKKQNAHHLLGYLAHLLVGQAFSLVYPIIWKHTSLKPNHGNSFLMGILNGFLGVVGWHVTIILHPDPPHIKLKKYYLQLIAAHAIFGWLNGLIYRVNGKKQE
ncbi:MAG: hypothetical protein ACNS62_18705 [Candidatus Cyclobacteriaceae bacterium M3_2C_046]